MKKFVLLLGLLFALQTQTALRAQVQEDEDFVVFNAHLLETFDLTVDGVVQEITFAVAADYNNGVTEGAGILPGYTEITVEATDIWNLTIEAGDFLPYGPNGGTNFIPIENLGVYCTVTLGGAHTFGAEVETPCEDAASALGLTLAPQLLIDNGTGNAGDATDNMFTLHWLMGTQDGTMYNAGSMFDQMANGDFTIGDYTTTATLTLFSLP